MADKAPKFARNPLSDLSDPSDPSGAWHLWPGGSWHLWPGGFNLVCQHWTTVCSVPGTCWGEAVQPGLPALGGGLSSAWHEWHCTPGVSAQVL